MAKHNTDAMEVKQESPMAAGASNAGPVSETARPVRWDPEGLSLCQGDSEVEIQSLTDFSVFKAPLSSFLSGFTDIADDLMG